MSWYSTEADARIVIDELLRQAGWDPTDKRQVRAEVHVAPGESPRVSEGLTSPTSLALLGGALGGLPGAAVGYAAGKAAKHLGSGGSKAARADYVLYAQNGHPLAIIEAKKKAINPYVAKQQTLPYAKEIGAPFIFLTNGELIYFWDYKNDDARIVAAFYSRRDMERLVEMRESRKPLATIEIPEYYIRQGETREVRPYQRDVMKALDHTVELGRRHFLMELPTGTGKTDITCLYLKRLFQAGWAERVLVLVDREQLAKQALEAIQDVLREYSSYWLKAGMVRQEQQITVCLLQTMIGQHMDFSSGYFDVVITDESHRSIYGAAGGTDSLRRHPYRTDGDPG